jgi:hypothetical protein
VKIPDLTYLLQICIQQQDASYQYRTTCREETND